MRKGRSTRVEDVEAAVLVNKALRQKLQDAREKSSQLMHKLKDARRIQGVFGDLFDISLHNFVRAADVPLPVGADVKAFGPLRIAYPRHDAGSDFIVDHLVEADIFPLKPHSLLLAGMKARRGGVMIDIGANLGTTVIPPLVLGLADRCIAIEAERANFDCLQWTLRANGLDRFIEAHHTAAGSTRGEANLAVTSASGLHHISASHRDDDAVDYQVVPMISLDDIVRDELRPEEFVSLVKVDTQGFELDILRGSEAVLAQRSAVWEVEFWPDGLRARGSDPDDVIEILQRSFRHFLDEKSSDNLIRPVSELPAAAALLTGTHHTDFLLLH